jgi:hypothetical protein
MLTGPLIIDPRGLNYVTQRASVDADEGANDPHRLSSASLALQGGGSVPVRHVEGAGDATAHLARGSSALLHRKSAFAFGIGLTGKKAGFAKQNLWNIDPQTD